jgi:hypothetical protein
MTQFLFKIEDITFFFVNYFMMLQYLRYIVLNSMTMDQLKRIWKEAVWPNGSTILEFTSVRIARVLGYIPTQHPSECKSGALPLDQSLW